MSLVDPFSKGYERVAEGGHAHASILVLCHRRIDAQGVFWRSLFLTRGGGPGQGHVLNGVDSSPMLFVWRRDAGCKRLG